MSEGSAKLPIDAASGQTAVAATPLPVPALATTSVQPLDTCWNGIGVYGDGSCAELKKFIHCRNCGVFSAAAHRLLDRPLPEAYRQEWTRHFAQIEKVQPPARKSAVVFRLKAEWLALPTHAFQEVGERRPIHSLPHRRDGIVLGLVNVRGELLVCVALDRF